MIRAVNLIRAVLALAFIVVAVTAHADTLVLTPKYNVDGTNPNGSEICRHRDHRGHFRHDLHDSLGNRQLGVQGLRHAHERIGCRDLCDPRRSGLIIYRVEDGGVLSGLWSVRGHDGSGTERLTPQK
jgi:hypothetical protein